MDDEIWRPIPLPDCEGYEVSSHGRVRNAVRGNTFHPTPDKNGRRTVCIFNSRNHYVSRLVAAAFLGVSERLVIHKDGNLSNDHLDNLKYETYSEVITRVRKSRNYWGWKINEKQLEEILSYADSEKYSIAEVAAMYNLTPEYVGILLRAAGLKKKAKVRKLSSSDIQDIMKAIADGTSLTKIAHGYQVSLSMISRIKHGSRRKTAP